MLSYFGKSVDKVVEALLESNFPPHFVSMDRSAKFDTKTNQNMEKTSKVSNREPIESRKKEPMKSTSGKSIATAYQKKKEYGRKKELI